MLSDPNVQDWLIIASGTISLLLVIAAFALMVWTHQKPDDGPEDWMS